MDPTMPQITSPYSTAPGAGAGGNAPSPALVNMIRALQAQQSQNGAPAQGQQPAGQPPAGQTSPQGLATGSNTPNYGAFAQNTIQGLFNPAANSVLGNAFGGGPMMPPPAAGAGGSFATDPTLTALNSGAVIGGGM
jgi:hypothetical protein